MYLDFWVFVAECLLVERGGENVSAVLGLVYEEYLFGNVNRLQRVHEVAHFCNEFQTVAVADFVPIKVNDPNGFL